MKNLKKLVTHRSVIAVISVLIQLGAIVYLILGLSVRFWWIYLVLQVAAFFVVLYLTTQDETNPKYIQTWTIIVLGIPIIGITLYFLLGNRKMPKELLQKSMLLESEVGIGSVQDTETFKEFLIEHQQWTKTMTYLERMGHFPVYDKTSSQYFGSGEEAFKDIKEKLNNANKYIFMEYFIIKFGKMWDEILEILLRKVKEGVDVRVIYDDWGSPELDKRYVSKLRGQGLKIYPFNKLTYKFVVQMNNRSHRKITIIDGEYGYISGYNIGDEYINTIERFGYWKDNAVRIRGAAVISLIDMFLTFWSFCSNDPKENIRLYQNSVLECEDDGFIQPFSDNPSDDLTVAETLHINAINSARETLYIVTPYLIIGHEMIRALSNAAMTGVDVRVVLPGIPDKKLVYMVSRSHYLALMEAGVKVYEYTPGFIHQKVVIVDEELAIISTANMDYRSYYLNFECGLCCYNSTASKEAVADFKEIIEVSKEVTLKEVRKLPFYTRFMRAIVGLFSGLL